MIKNINCHVSTIQIIAVWIFDVVAWVWIQNFSLLSFVVRLFKKKKKLIIGPKKFQLLVKIV